jgi:YbbR domain-containing protein
MMYRQRDFFGSCQAFDSPGRQQRIELVKKVSQSHQKVESQGKNQNNMLSKKMSPSGQTVESNGKHRHLETLKESSQSRQKVDLSGQHRDDMSSAEVFRCFQGAESMESISMMCH